jgi:hypothetical protein
LPFFKNRDNQSFRMDLEESSTQRSSCIFKAADCPCPDQIE